MDVRLDEAGNPMIWEDDVASAVLRSSFDDLRDVKLTQRMPKTLTRPLVDRIHPPGRPQSCLLQQIVADTRGVCHRGWAAAKRTPKALGQLHLDVWDISERLEVR
jgi:hypothetical protein